MIANKNFATFNDQQKLESGPTLLHYSNTRGLCNMQGRDFVIIRDMTQQITTP